MTCNYFAQNQCRSCTLLPLGGVGAFEHKTKNARSTLSPFIDKAIEEPGVQVDEPYGSRHKAKLIVSGTTKKPIFGIVDSTGSFSSLERCPLHNPLLNEILLHLKEFITQYKLTPYDISRRTGEIKGVLLSTNLSADQVMVRVVLRSKDNFTAAQTMLTQLQLKVPQVAVTSINIQPIPHAILEGDEEIVTSKQTYLVENFEQIKILFDPQSFMQITPVVAKELYKTAAQWVDLHRPKTVMDLYCGVGGFALHVTKKASSVVGVEVSSAAIQCAKESAKINKLDNCEFICGNLENFLLGTPVEILITNPPRRGLSDNVIAFITATMPKVVLYSSCNPVTLARDLSELTKYYAVKKIRFFDMFPLTSHLETLVELTKN